jgi:hypothetical protein
MVLELALAIDVNIMLDGLTQFVQVVCIHVIVLSVMLVMDVLHM